MHSGRLDEKKNSTYCTIHVKALGLRIKFPVAMYGMPVQ